MKSELSNYVGNTPNIDQKSSKFTMNNDYQEHQFNTLNRRNESVSSLPNLPLIVGNSIEEKVEDTVDSDYQGELKINVNPSVLTSNRDIKKNFDDKVGGKQKGDYSFDNRSLQSDSILPKIMIGK